MRGRPAHGTPPTFRGRKVGELRTEGRGKGLQEQAEGRWSADSFQRERETFGSRGIPNLAP